MPMMEMFDRGVQLRMGQAHIRRWIDDLLPVVSDDRDPLGVRQFATHHLPLEDAPRGYDLFRDKATAASKSSPSPGPRVLPDLRSHGPFELKMLFLSNGP